MVFSMFFFFQKQKMRFSSMTGQCKLLLETNQTTIVGHQLNISDIYGDDSLQSITDHRLNGLITNEINRCNLIVFFSRDIRVC